MSQQMTTTPRPQQDAERPAEKGMEYVSVNKNYLTIREKDFGYIIIPTELIQAVAIKGNNIRISLKDRTVFKCHISKPASAAIDRISIYDEPNGNSNAAKLFRNTCCESVTGKKVRYIRTEQLILSGGLFLLAFFIPAMVSYFSADPEFCLGRSSSLIFLTMNFALYNLVASDFSKTKKQNSVNYFRCNSKWLHLQSAGGLYYSVRKDYIREVYHLNCGKYILLKNNDCLPCSDDYISGELASAEIKRERRWLWWGYPLWSCPAAVILTVFYLLLLF